MSLHVRNPGRVQKITEQGAQELRAILIKNPEEYEAVRQPEDPPTLAGWVERYTPALMHNFGKSLLTGIVTHQATGNEIIRMHWGVWGSDASSPDILTSDRPLFLSHGIDDLKCVIALPISPRAVFLASRDQKRLDTLIAMGSPALIRAVNESTVTQAVRYVYGAHANALGFVEHWLTPDGDRGVAKRDSRTTDMPRLD